MTNYFSILTIVFLYWKKTKLIQNKFIFGFVISTLILVFKSSEHLPPLLFFYFAFIDLIYKEKHKENKKNSLKEMSLN